MIPSFLSSITSPVIQIQNIVPVLEVSILFFLISVVTTGRFILIEIFSLYPAFLVCFT